MASSDDVAADGWGTADGRVPTGVRARAGGAVPLLAPDELAGVLGTPRAPQVVDVRQPDEFADWSIPGAVNIPGDELAARSGELDRDRATVVVCGSGHRSRIAAQELDTDGFDVSDLAGGMQAWALVYDTATIDLDPVRIVQVRRRGKGCLSYLVGAGDEAFVVDPSLATDRYLAEADGHGWRVTRVFDTHLHADHVSGARALAAAAGATLHLNAADGFAFPFEPLVDGQRFSLGGAATVMVRALSTPGHTRGSTVFDIDGRAVLSGDTLFVDGIGRPDLADQAEAFARDLYRSLHRILLDLPDDLLVLPAHFGASVEVHPAVPVATPLARLRDTLGPLGWDEETFVAWASSRSAPRPPNFVRIVNVNQGTDTCPPDECRRLELGPNRCAA